MNIYDVTKNIRIDKCNLKRIYKEDLSNKNINIDKIYSYNDYETCEKLDRFLKFPYPVIDYEFSRNPVYVFVTRESFCRKTNNPLEVGKEIFLFRVHFLYILNYKRKPFNCITHIFYGTNDEITNYIGYDTHSLFTCTHTILKGAQQIKGIFAIPGTELGFGENGECFMVDSNLISARAKEFLSEFLKAKDIGF